MGKRISPNSTLHEFAIPSQTGTRRVLAKTPAARGQLRDRSCDEQDHSVARPRFVESDNRRVRAQFEYAALSLIDSHFGALGDSRFTTVRPLAFLPETGTIIMQKVAHPDLRSLLAKASRLHRLFSHISIDESLGNAGAWLRTFHDMPQPSHVRRRHTRRDDYIESMQQFTRFLATVIGDAPFFRQLAIEASAKAQNVLPAVSPSSLAHGDFAPRNILVGQESEIAVFDTAARWCTSVYKDLAYFLGGLKAPRAQIYTQGLAFDKAELASYERAFLQGYFGESSIPWSAIRLYELQALIDKWTAMVERIVNQDSPVAGFGWRRQAAALQLGVVGSFFRRRVRRLLRDCC